MLNFKELSSNGDDFELLIREILYNKGLEVYWSGKGPDGGKDLLCVERHKSYFKSSSKRWLIQCKHNAHSGKSVGIGDLDDIVDSCTEHDATGYLLVCSTYPSSGVVKRLEGIQSRGRITTEFWDYCVLERELLKPENWSLITMFMPKSADKLGWRISSIDTYLWYASYNGNIFYIALRIGTNCEYYLKHISDRIEEINNIKLPKGHIIRLRAIYFDDKYTNYRLYLDYLIPQGTSERKVEVNDDIFEICSDRIIDGVSYTVDLVMYEYAPWSDNFDIDHQGYYSQFISSFKCGGSRNGE
ncbi:restriction endonuclease [Clostridium chromiireducens]|uniref:restriction endonuclease n=1 Tax=Clostridium chromiireducens TaxID=225345 RepID=UPI003AF56691